MTFFQKTAEEYHRDADYFRSLAALDGDTDVVFLDLGRVADRLAQEAVAIDGLHMAGAFDQAIERIRQRRAAWLRGRIEAGGFRLVERAGRWFLKGDRERFTAEVESQAREWRQLVSA